MALSWDSLELTRMFLFRLDVFDLLLHFLFLFFLFLTPVQLFHVYLAIDNVLDRVVGLVDLLKEVINLLLAMHFLLI